MKKNLLVAIGVFVALALMLTACGILPSRTVSCHRCGKDVGSDPVKAGGRTYCSYNCYMSEALFN